ncbi:MAG: methionine--tRNA ligase [Candidatus Diapherotrites archaeon]|nr:methionine--tRNA ligase [Candidatus Diapherotrites archaeon]
MIILPASPIFGHAYEKTCADVQARYHRLLGEKVFFLTGTDEHGQKIQRKAEAAGKPPKQYVDEMSVHFKALCNAWNFSFDRFIRTTDKDHEKKCRQLFKLALDNGDIYLGKYEGLYCAQCEAFYLEKDLADGKCKMHKVSAEPVSEPSYFFRMAKYQKYLVDLLEKNPEIVRPEGKRLEILNRIKAEPLRDLSVSRTSFSWGIPLPNDKKHTIYVWWDALVNYLTGVGWPDKNFKTFWPANVQNIGVDIVWFHSAIWFSMLKSMGIAPPKQVWVHGFINTASGEKMSKSLGNVIDPLELVQRYPVDAVRYYLMREIPFGQDGSFSEQALVERINNELANELGNLLNRTIVMLEKYHAGKIPKSKTNAGLQKSLNLKKIQEKMDAFEFHEALNETFAFMGSCNKFINEREPWKQSGKQLDETLYSLADSLRIISILISPFMPETSGKINAQLGVKAGLWKDTKFNLLKAGAKTKKGEVLFQKMKFEEKVETARPIKVVVDKDVMGLGLKVFSAVVENAKIKNKHSGLEREKKDAAEKTDLSSPEANNLIREYEKVYDRLGISNVTNSVRNLVEQVKVQGKLPQINTAVDAYNLVSLRRKVVVGAHDISKLSGDIRFRIYDGKTPYTPLGSQAKKEIPKGGFAVEDSKEVICWLDEKQCEHTKVDNGTRHIVLYVQGNNLMSDDYCKNALKEICEKITNYCGGTWKEI